MNTYLLTLWEYAIIHPAMTSRIVMTNDGPPDGVDTGEADTEVRVPVTTAVSPPWTLISDDQS